MSLPTRKYKKRNAHFVLLSRCILRIFKTLPTRQYKIRNAFFVLSGEKA